MKRPIALLILVLSAVLFLANCAQDNFQIATTGTLKEVQDAVEKGASVNATDNFGGTMLTRAARFNSPEVVAFLLKAGSDVQIKDKLGWTALMEAGQRAYQPDIVISLLLEAGADAKATNSEGKTALDVALKNKMLAGTDALKRLEQATGVQVAENENSTQENRTVTSTNQGGNDRFWKIQANYTGDDGTNYVEVLWYDSMELRLVGYQSGTADDPKILTSDGSRWAVDGDFTRDTKLLQDSRVGTTRTITQELFRSDGHYVVNVAGTGTRTLTAFGTWKVMAKSATYP